MKITVETTVNASVAQVWNAFRSAKLKSKTLIVILSCVMLTSCALNEFTAQRYAQAGNSASQQGNWAVAQEDWRRAIINAKLARMNDKALAIAFYEYGRASGVVCDWANAERALNEAKQRDLAGGGPAHMAIYELGRMYFDRKQYANAVEQYALVKTYFDKVQAETKDPVGYADYLDEYAVALEQTEKSSEAQPLRARSSELRGVFPGKSSQTEKTPYGTQCKNT